MSDRNERIGRGKGESDREVRTGASAAQGEPSGKKQTQNPAGPGGVPFTGTRDSDIADHGYSVGDRVRIHSLKAKQQYNRRTGNVVSFEGARLGVRLEDGSALLSLKPENLERPASPESTSTLRLNQCFLHGAHLLSQHL